MNLKYDMKFINTIRMSIGIGIYVTIIHNNN